MTKLCRQTKSIGCGRTLDITLFGRKGLDGHQTHCNECYRVYRNSNKIVKLSNADIARAMCDKLIKEIK